MIYWKKRGLTENQYRGGYCLKWGEGGLDSLQI